MSFQLVVLHPQASRTGSTRLLVEYLEWQKAQRIDEASVRFWTELPGLEDATFREIGLLHHLLPNYAHSRGWRARLLMRFWWRPWVCPFRLSNLSRDGKNASVALVNTVANFRLLSALPEEIPVVTFVHELELSIARLLRLEEMAELVRRTSVFLVPSEAAGRNLRDRHGVRENAIIKIRPWRNEHRIKTERSSEKIRQSMSVGAVQKLVVACGYRDWVKGPDIFLSVAAAVARNLGEGSVRFLWIGAPADEVTQVFLESYTRHLGLEEIVTFVDEMPDPTDYFAAADAFVLTSRVESFGLVALEAACAGTPVVFFAAAGGPSEFLSAPLGHEVLSLSPSAMAETVVALLRAPVDGPEREAQAAQLRKTHRLESQAPLIWDALHAVAKPR